VQGGSLWIESAPGGRPGVWPRRRPHPPTCRPGVRGRRRRTAP